MLYWFVLILLLISALSEFYRRKINSNTFFLAYLILTLIMTLKQGQGQDYYNYYQIYKETEFWSEYGIWSVILMRGDPAYSLINLLMIKLEIPYIVYASIFSFLIMLIQYNFFKKDCNCSCICLFIFYSTIFISYDCSAMRQGMAMAIILGIGYPLIEKGRTKQFIIVGLIASTIHLSAIICLLIPFIIDLKFSYRTTLLIIILSTLFIICGSDLLNHLPLPEFMYNRLNAYQESSATKYLAIGVRLLDIIPILLITRKGYDTNKSLLHLKNILLFGFIIYSICSFNDFIASRENIYFRMFEGLFLYQILFKTNFYKIKKSVFYLYVILSLIIFPKDILASMAQGEYRNCNLFTYPYLTIFDSNQTIAYYRTNFGYVDEQL